MSDVGPVGCTCIFCRGEAITPSHVMGVISQQDLEWTHWQHLEWEAHRAQLLKDIRAEVLEAIKEAKEKGWL